MQYSDHLTQLENAIKAAQEAALEAADTDSILTGTSLPQDDASSILEQDEKLGGMTIPADVSLISKADLSGATEFGDMADYADSSGEFVDVEGEDAKEEEEVEAETPKLHEYNDHNVLVDDLQITPENSDNEVSDSEFKYDMVDGAEGFYESNVEQPEAMDADLIDENYDPSQFLLLGDFDFQQENDKKADSDMDEDLCF